MSIKEREDLADPIYNVPLDHMADDRTLAYTGKWKTTLHECDEAFKVVGKAPDRPIAVIEVERVHMNEDTTQMDLELIASDLEGVAKLAGRLNHTDLATEIGALVAKVREKAKAHGQAEPKG